MTTIQHDPSPQLAEALDLLKRERYAAAGAALAALPPTPEIRWQLGVALHGQNRHDEALAVLRPARRALPDEADRWRCAIDIAITHNKRGNPSAAERILVLCLAALTRLGTQADQLKCALYVAITQSRRGRYTAFLESYAALAPRLKAHAPVDLQVIGLVSACASHTNLGNYAEAQACMEEGQDLALRADLIYRLALFGTYRLRMALELGDATITEADAEQLEDLCMQSGAGLALIDCLTYRALFRYRQGDLDGAVAYNERAFEAYQALGYQDGAATCKSNIGVFAFAQGRYAHALAALADAETRAGECGAVITQGIARLLSGWVHVLLGSHDIAALKLTQALAQFEPLEQRQLALRACLLLVSADSDNARIWLQRVDAALAIHDPSVQRADARLSQGQLELGIDNIAAARAHLVDARDHFARLGYVLESLRCEVPLLACDLRAGDLAHDLVALDGIEARLAALGPQISGMPDLEIQTLMYQAECLLLRSRPHDALPVLQSAANLTDIVRREALDPVLAGRVTGVFEHVHALGLSLAYQTGNAPLAEAFAHSRRTTARRWQSGRAVQSTSGSGSTKGNKSTIDARRLTQQAIQLRLRSSHLMSAVYPDQPADIETLRRNNETARAAQIEFNAQQMARSSLSQPAHDSQADGPRPLEVFRDGLNRQFGAAWRALSIEPLQPHQDAWLLLDLTPDQLRLKHLAPTPKIRHALRSLGKAGRTWRESVYGDTEYAQAVLQMVSDWLEIDTLLPESADPLHPPVLILADTEPFSAINLTALPLRPGGSLGQSVAVLHTPDWTGPAKPTKRPGSPQVLVIAPIEFDGRHPDLPSADQEVARCLALWSAARVLYRQDATMEAVRNLAASGELGKFDLIVLATHACFMSDQPRLSALAFADGDIGAHEVSTWALNSACVLVSACEGGRSATWSGETRLGIDQSLLEAGAGHVISALWPVLDAEASEFASLFMTAYHSSGSALESFWQAQYRAAKTQARVDWAAWRIIRGS